MRRPGPDDQESSNSRSGRPSSWIDLSVAVGGGVLWGLCFGKEPSVWLPWLALAPLIWLVGRRRAVWWGLLHGVVSWLIAAYWIAATVETFGDLPVFVSWLLLILLCVYLGAYHALFVVLARSTCRGGVWAGLFGLPALWVVLEWLRGILLGGFPWNLAAYAWVDVPGALPAAAWIGPYGVSALVVLVNASVVMATSSRHKTLGLAMILGVLVFLPVAGRWSRATEPDRVARRITVLQPNLPILRTVDAAVLDSYNKLMRLSEKECGEAKLDERRLLVWPESATWPFSYQTAPRLRQDLSRLVDSGCDVVLNTASSEPEGLYNSALLIDESGLAGRYDKRHLVPFGEYVPFAELLPFVGHLARAAGSFSAGDSVTLLPWLGERLAMAICYEVTYPEALAEQVRAGATVLATITNDAWYGDSSAPAQHFRAARFRAAENRRPLVRAALTGISGIVDARGAVGARLAVGQEGALTARVFGSTEFSPYTRAPWLVPASSFLVVAFAIVRGRHDGRQSSDRKKNLEKRL